MTQIVRDIGAENTRFVDETLLVSGSERALRGARCPECSTTTFPAQAGCPKCGAQGMDTVTLATRGRLWSFTVQNFQPKKPYRPDGDFEPYGVGYVDLGEVIVETRLIENRPDRLAIGQAVQLQFVRAFVDEDGTEVLTFAFGEESR